MIIIGENVMVNLAIIRDSLAKSVKWRAGGDMNSCGKTDGVQFLRCVTDTSTEIYGERQAAFRALKAESNRIGQD